MSGPTRGPEPEARGVTGAPQPVSTWSLGALTSLLDAFAEDHPQKRVGEAMQEAARRLRAALSQAGEPGREAIVRTLEAKKYPAPLAYDQSIWNAAMNEAIEVVRSAGSASSGATREGATFPLTLSDGSVVTREMDAPGTDGTPFYLRTKGNALIAESYDWLHCIIADDCGADHDKLKAAAARPTPPSAGGNDA